MISSIASLGLAGTLRDRFKAWWHGYDVDVPDQLSGAAGGAAGGGPSGKGEWTAQRVAAVQAVLGPGIDAPGAVGHVAELIAPLGLSAEMSVLEVGCGLGVGLRHIADAVGAQTLGIEPNAPLVEVANRLIAEQELSDKAAASTEAIGAEGPVQGPHDLVLSREALHRLTDRDFILAAVPGLLKPGGQLLYTDFMQAEEEAHALLDAWLDMHPERPQLRTLEQAREELSEIGLEVQAAEDDSAAFRARVMGALQAFAANLQRDPVTAQMREWVMWEVEYLARTAGVVESGALKLGRLHAVKAAEDGD